MMSANYKNWVPKGLIYGLFAGTVTMSSGAVTLGILCDNTVSKVISGVLGIGSLALLCGSVWCVYAYHQFSYNGKRKLSKQIVEGVADYVKLPEGRIGLDRLPALGNACRSCRCHLRERGREDRQQVL